MVNKIDAKQFDELLKGDKPVVCDFYATWCGPCKMLAPVMDKVSEKFSDKAEFVKVDIDENMELAGKYRVMSIPTIILFKAGEAVSTTVGAVSKNELEGKIAQVLA